VPQPRLGLPNMLRRPEGRPPPSHHFHPLVVPAALARATPWKFCNQMVLTGEKNSYGIFFCPGIMVTTLQLECQSRCGDKRKIEVKLYFICGDGPLFEANFPESAKRSLHLLFKQYNLVTRVGGLISEYYPRSGIDFRLSE
jgi:hypothetical protein